MPTWQTAASWNLPLRRMDWAVAGEWSASFSRVVGVAGDQLANCLLDWDQALSDIGCDPARTDWSAFRPLRLSREEDWSDWLAHLLESSQTGRFAGRLLGRDVGAARDWRVTHAEREVIAGEYRADIVAHFHDQSWAHIEVKVGDLELSKTPGTTEALKHEHQSRFRCDFLLLPVEDVPQWDEVRQGLGLSLSAQGIQTLTWTECALALRASVREADESLVWRVWAATFVGAIEQRILGFPQIALGAKVCAVHRPVERLRFFADLSRET